MPNASYRTLDTEVLIVGQDIVSERLEALPYARHLPHAAQVRAC